jgi:hypothetical protein
MFAGFDFALGGSGRRCGLSTPGAEVWLAVLMGRRGRTARTARLSRHETQRGLAKKGLAKTELGDEEKVLRFERYPICKAAGADRKGERAPRWFKIKSPRLKQLTKPLFKVTPANELGQG